jgi:hypothetical protein
MKTFNLKKHLEELNAKYHIDIQLEDVYIVSKADYNVVAHIDKNVVAEKFQDFKNVNIFNDFITKVNTKRDAKTIKEFSDFIHTEFNVEV